MTTVTKYPLLGMPVTYEDHRGLAKAALVIGTPSSIVEQEPRFGVTVNQLEEGELLLLVIVPTGRTYVRVARYDAEAQTYRRVEGKRIPARFQSFLTAQVLLYVRGQRDRLNRRASRELLVCDKPSDEDYYDGDEEDPDKE